MNILQIGTIDNRGGAARISYGLKEKLQQLGHLCNMFVSKKYSNDPNVHVIKTPIYKKIFCRLLGTDIDFWETDFILKTEEFKKADVVHCHNLHGYYFNLKTLQKISQQKPLIWTLHDMWAITPYCHHTFADLSEEGFFPCSGLETYPKLAWHNRPYLCRKKMKIYNNSKLQIVTPSNWLKKKVEKSILAKHPITLIQNGVDTQIFHKHNQAKARKDLQLPVGKKIIMFLADGGKINPWKDWGSMEKIIAHYKKNKNILFLCIGGNKNINNSNVRELKYVLDDHLLSKFYSASDLFILSSKAENSPLTILEAMACGTPIVSFNLGGINEMIVHKVNGYLADHKNAESLIHGIEYLFSLNQDDLQKIFNDSIKKVKTSFSLDIMVSGYLKLYEQALKN